MHEKELEVESGLLAVGSIDGRYRRHTRLLEPYFSEFALIRYRLRIEIEWYIRLAADPSISGIDALDDATQANLRNLYENFPLAEAHKIKAIEATTKHDVKALEYYLRECFEMRYSNLPTGMIHLGCTSEDINNLAYALILKEVVNDNLGPRLGAIVATLGELAHRHRALPMLARTHGQPATPTTMGKELAVFAARLKRQIIQLKGQEYLGKFNGAVGNLNAHQIAYPEIDWIAHSRRFVAGLGLTWNPLTTQIEGHDFIAELFDTLVRVCTILLGFSRDMWGYISLGYFIQRAAPGEVGSSTMPHKVNPIDFENCEGNLGIAIALFQHLAVKLPVSRWQRDLSDSTALRSIGTAFGHLTIALASLEAGLSKVEVNPQRLESDLNDGHGFEVLAEAIQTVMRRRGLPHPYETLKELTRGRHIDRKMIREFVENLPLDQPTKAMLSELTPERYVGLAARLVEQFAPQGNPWG